MKGGHCQGWVDSEWLLIRSSSKFPVLLAYYFLLPCYMFVCMSQWSHLGVCVELTNSSSQGDGTTACRKPGSAWGGVASSKWAGQQRVQRRARQALVGGPAGGRDLQPQSELRGAQWSRTRRAPETQQQLAVAGQSSLWQLLIVQTPQDMIGCRRVCIL